MSRAFAATAGLLVWAAVLSARQAPTFRGAIDLIQLDVSVLDKDRRPVRGLTAADFTVLEDGKAQTISAFAAVDVPGSEAVTTPWMREVTPDVATNSRLSNRLIVLVLDDASIQKDTFAIENAKKIARAVIEHLAPADFASVVFTRDNRNSQNFTTDRARLFAAVEKFQVGFRDMGNAIDPKGAPLPDTLYFTYSAQVLGEIARQLDDASYVRKLIIYVGQGVPVDISGAISVGVPGRSLGPNELQQKLQLILADTFRRARQANINVYTIDPCGFRHDPPPDPPPPTCVPGLEVDYLQTVASATGGRAVINSNDPTPGIGQIFDENGSYYLLGFRSPSPKAAGAAHRLDVGVNRPGVLVRTRSGYTVPKAEKTKKADEAGSSLRKALSGVQPTPDIALQVHAATFGQRDKDPRVAIVLGVRQTDLASAEKRVVEDLALQVSAFTPEGQPRGSQRQNARVVVRAGASGDIEYEILTGIDLKPGRYEIRIAADSTRDKKSGSVYADVIVPDFAKEPLSMSGIELTASLGPVAAPQNAFAALMPIAPTSRREFRPSDKVTAFWRVYQGGKAPVAPIDMKIHVQGIQPEPITETTEIVGSERFSAQRSADRQFELQTGKLTPGPYLLTVEAKLANSIVRRDVRFRILDK